MLLEAARILRARKMEFDAWLVLEAGKTWPEAEADVSEGIDFCEYYAREMLRLAGPQRVHQLPGEHDEMIYIPLGVGVVIPPWNFPAAILIGMAVASLVAGNTAIIKPSSETPTIAAKFAEVLLEAGFPEAWFTLLTGSGGTVGDALVEHPKTRFISFTGSRDVGLRINELAARHRPGQIWIKRVIAEMGGKDAIVVDADADLDKAVDGVLASAFGYQGQKCSACSRAIVDAQVYDAFLEKLAAKTKNIKVGASEDFGNYMGPVINETARQTILEYIEIGKREGRLVAGGEAGAAGLAAISSRPPSLRMSSRAPESFRKRFSARSWPSPKRAISSTRWPGQRLAIRPDRRGFLEQPRARPRGQRALPRRQPVFQPEVHRRDGGRAPVRRLQHVRHGFQGRRAGLSIAVPASEIGSGEGGVVSALAGAASRPSGDRLKVAAIAATNGNRAA